MKIKLAYGFVVMLNVARLIIDHLTSGLLD